MEIEIKAAIQQLLGAISAGDSGRVAAEMERLDVLVERGRAQLHPQLQHFLQNRSYAKALMFLGGDTDIPVGICGGRRGKANHGD